MAKACPLLLLTDLDERPCALELIEDWVKTPRHPDFLLRIAVREVEAWLLASDTALKQFLGSRGSVDFATPEKLEDPKSVLLKLAVGSPRRDIRDAIVRRDTGGNLRQGPAYNSTLSEFVDRYWQMGLASTRCPSLDRMLKALAALELDWKNRDE